MVTFKQYLQESEEMSPKVIKGFVNISDKNLTKIPEGYDGAIIGGDFHCCWNKLTSLEGAPNLIKGEFKSDQFTDEDYRNFVTKRDIIDPAKKKRQEDPDSLPW